MNSNSAAIIGKKIVFKYFLILLILLLCLIQFNLSIKFSGGRLTRGFFWFLSVGRQYKLILLLLCSTGVFFLIGRKISDLIGERIGVSVLINKEKGNFQFYIYSLIPISLVLFIAAFLYALLVKQSEDMRIFSFQFSFFIIFFFIIFLILTSVVTLPFSLFINNEIKKHDSKFTVEDELP